MAAAHPLRDVFTELTGDEEARRAHAADPDGFLAAHGHPDLPSDLVAEAVVSYADTAPPEVAEHLAPYVREHSPVPHEGDLTAEAAAAEPGSWFDLIATAPATDLSDPTDLPGVDGGFLDDAPPLDDDLTDGPDADFDFGRGAAAGAGVAAVVDHDGYAGGDAHAVGADAGAHGPAGLDLDGGPDASPDDLAAAGGLLDRDDDGDGAIDDDPTGDDPAGGDGDGVDL